MQAIELFTTGKHIFVCLLFNSLYFPDYTFLSVLWQEGYLVCKTLGVGLLMVMIWLQLCTSYSSSCHQHIHHPSANKIQNGDILVPANPGPPGKWPLKWRVERLLQILYRYEYWVPSHSEWADKCSCDVGGVLVSHIEFSAIRRNVVSDFHTRGNNCGQVTWQPLTHSRLVCARVFSGVFWRQGQLHESR